MKQIIISRVWVDDTHIYAETTDGMRASYAFTDWERLAQTTSQQREEFYLSYYGIHWPQIDEDLNFEGMFHDAGLCDITPTEDAVYYLTPYNTEGEPLPTAAEEAAEYGRK